MKHYKGYYPNNISEYYAVVSNKEWYYFSEIRRKWSRPVVHSGNWKGWIKGKPKSIRFEETSPLEVLVVCGCLFTKEKLNKN
jgi:hypothetical protein